MRAITSMMIANGTKATFSNRIFPTTVSLVRVIFSTVGWIIIKRRATMANNLPCIEYQYIMIHQIIILFNLFLGFQGINWYRFLFYPRFDENELRIREIFMNGRKEGGGKK